MYAQPTQVVKVNKGMEESDVPNRYELLTCHSIFVSNLSYFFDIPVYLYVSNQAAVRPWNQKWLTVFIQYIIEY